MGEIVVVRKPYRIFEQAPFRVTVPDQDVSVFTQMLKEHAYSYAVEADDDFVIPEWQKEAGRKSIRQTKPEEYKSREEVKTKLLDRVNLTLTTANPSILNIPL